MFSAVLFAAALAAEVPVVTNVELKAPDGAARGSATLIDAPRGVLIKLEAKGLAPGWHGLHFHEKADCSAADFTSAGGHTHGEGERIHGLRNALANETGDLPNLFVQADGTGTVELYSQLVTMSALLDADGSALVIHAGSDDHMSQPIGGAGARVACGAIR